MGSGRNKTLNAHPRSLDQCLDTVYSSNPSILSELYFCPVFSKPLTITFILTIHTGKEKIRVKEHHHPTSLNDVVKILKGLTADFMKEIEVQARARTGRRCPQGPDLGFTKPTRDSFQMLHSSFDKIKSILDDKGLPLLKSSTFQVSQPCRSNVSLPG